MSDSEIFTDARLVQPRKTLSSIDVTEFGINTSVREEQPLNAPAFISVTVSGIFIDSRAEQPLKQPVSMTETGDRRTVIRLGLYAKAYLPIDVTLSENVTALRAALHQNAASSMVSTPSARVMYSAEQSEKANLPIVLIPSGTVTSFSFPLYA